MTTDISLLHKIL